MRFITSFLFLLLIVHQVVYAAGFDCGRSFCGCWTPATLSYRTTIVDEKGSPLRGIKIICGSENKAIAVSDDDGKAEFLIETEYSPGCKYARCTNIKVIDEEGKFEEIKTTIFVTNGKEIVLSHKLEK